MELNKIYLGDCYELIKEIPDKSIDCIYTDVPYLLPNSPSQDGGFMAKRVSNFMRNEVENFRDGFDYSLLDEYVRVNKTLNIFIWCNKFLVKDLLDYFIDKGCKKYEILTWNKTNPIPMTNNVWLSDIEYCLWFGETSTKLNDGYKLKSKWYTTPINKADKDDYGHPTIKPLELVKRHILHTTQAGGVVLDTFMGSGTTAKACQETGRNFIGFEINEEYWKIANDRLNGINAKGEISLL